MERLALLMDELFGLSISEGAICNILARRTRASAGCHSGDREGRAGEPRGLLGRDIGAGQRQELVGVGIRYHLGGAACDPTQPEQGRGNRAVGTIRAEVWVSDMLGSQRGHGVLWQVCLAHLLRDAKYAIECGDTAFSAPFRWLLLRAIAIGRRREALKDTTLRQYLYDLDRRLDRIMAAVPVGEPGRKLHKRMLANRAHLFVFMSNRAVPFTNNISERHLRPSVIFRKVTNGFRCEWGAETYAAFRSVVSTAKANRASVLDTVRFVYQPNDPETPSPGRGEQIVRRETGKE